MALFLGASKVKRRTSRRREIGFAGSLARRASHGRPGIRTRWAGRGEATRPDERAGPPSGGVDLSLVDQFEQLAAKRPRLQVNGYSLKVRADVRREGLTGELPDHGAQLRLHAEAQPVIHEPDLSVRVPETVAGLPIRVV